MSGKMALYLMMQKLFANGLNIRAPIEENMNTEVVKFIRFEDLIYKYEDTTKDLINWLKLDEKKHGRRGMCFKPEVSINNTQTWLRYPQSLPEIKIIEQRLGEYLYDFPNDYKILNSD